MKKHLYLIIILIWAFSVSAQSKILQEEKWVSENDEPPLHIIRQTLDEVTPCVLKFEYQCTISGSILYTEYDYGNYIFLTPETILRTSETPEGESKITIISDIMFLNGKINPDDLVLDFHNKNHSYQTIRVGKEKFEPTFKLLQKSIENCQSDQTHWTFAIKDKANDKFVDISLFEKFDAIPDLFFGYSFNVVMRLSNGQRYRLNIPNLEAFNRMLMLRKMDQLFIEADSSTCALENDIAACDYVLKESILFRGSELLQNEVLEKQ